MTDIVTGLQELTQGLPPLLRWVGVLLAGAIPYVEAEGAAVLGVVAGVNPVVAILAAVVGNAIALAVVVWLIGAARSRRGARRRRARRPRPSPRRPPTRRRGRAVRRTRPSLLR